MISPKPWKTIWLHPRDTVRRIVADDPSYGVVLLACLSGVSSVLDRASFRNLGDQVPLATILILACTLGPLIGLLSLWAASHLVRWTGNWLGGSASRTHIKTAMAWALVPVVFALLLLVPELILFREEVFTSGTPSIDSNLAPALALFLLEIVLGVWSLVLACHTVAEVQGFRSAWRGLGNILLPGVVVLVLILVLFAIAFALRVG